MDTSIPAELQERLAQQAAAAGYPSGAAFLRAVLDNVERSHRPPALTEVEFRRLLEGLATDDLPSLPPGFSRADIYADHD
jgi:hypothetical protein